MSRMVFHAVAEICRINVGFDGMSLSVLYENENRAASAKSDIIISSGIF